MATKEQLRKLREKYGLGEYKGKTKTSSSKRSKKSKKRTTSRSAGFSSAGKGFASYEPASAQVERSNLGVIGNPAEPRSHAPISIFGRGWPVSDRDTQIPIRRITR